MPLWSPDRTKCFILNPKSASSYVQTVLTRVGWTREGGHEPASALDLAPGVQVFSTIREPHEWYASVYLAAMRENPGRLRGASFVRSLEWWMRPEWALLHEPVGSWPPFEPLRRLGDPPKESLWSAATRFFLGARRDMEAPAPVRTWGVDALIDVTQLLPGLQELFDLKPRELPDRKINALAADQSPIEWKEEWWLLVDEHDGPLWRSLFNARPIIWLG